MSPWPPEGEPSGKGTQRGDAAAARARRPRGRRSSTGTTTSATRSSARARARRRCTSRPVRSRRRCSPRSAITVAGRVLEIGGADTEDGWRDATDAARADRDTLGGIVEVVAEGVPPGLGSYAEKATRLDARLAAALMGIQAVKGVEIGDGFALARLRGSEAHDEIEADAARADEPRRRDRGRRHERRAGRRPRGDEAAADADAAAPLGRPRDAASPARRSSSAATSQAVEALAVVAEAAVAWELARAAREKFGGDALGDFVARARRVPGADRVGARARPAPRPRRLHGGGQDDARRGARRAAREAVPRRRRRGRGDARPDRGAVREARARRRSASSRRARRATCCARGEPSVVALGGGAVETRGLLGELDVADGARSTWTSRRRGERVRDCGRPLAQDEDEFRRRYERRRPLYDAVADARATDADGVVLAAAGIALRAVAPRSLGERGGRRGRARRRAPRDRARLTLRAGERRKTRRGGRAALAGARASTASATLVAVGGGSTTDLVGFVAATYLRGIAWIAVPSTLVGQVDAAIGGKTAIDLPEGKNLVGAFHWPAATTIDPRSSRRCPRRSVATASPRSSRRACSRGAALGARDGGAGAALRRVQGGRLPARPSRAGGARAPQPRPHVRARARGGVRLRASRTGARSPSASSPRFGFPVSRTRRARSRSVLAPEPVAVDRDAAWAALQRDKKARGGRVRLVLLDAPGEPARHRGRRAGARPRGPRRADRVGSRACGSSS